MFLTNIGFVFFLFFSNKENPIAAYEIVFLMVTYYRFIVPFFIILLLFYVFQERKDKVKNSKIQNIITILNLAFFVLILLSFILFIIFVAMIAHGLDM